MRWVPPARPGVEARLTITPGLPGCTRWRASNEELIGYWDYGSSITLQDEETFAVDFGASILTLA